MKNQGNKDSLKNEIIYIYLKKEIFFKENVYYLSNKIYYLNKMIIC